MPKKLKQFLLVDGNALVHRAYHALPPLTTKKGELVNAVYGFTTLLLKAIHDLKPEYVAVAFDLKGPTFRHEAYKEYKATRAKAPDELYAQFDRVKEVVSTLNIPIFGVKGFEADDVIGTLSKQAKEKQIETIILTGDMDTLQLVNHLVKVYTMRRGFTDTVLYDAEAVKEKYGLTPEQFVDFKALKGDASDNIPGVDGIGEKTAAALIDAFGSLDNLYSFLEKVENNEEQLVQAPTKITPRVKDLLIQGKQQAYDSQHLSQIILDVPIELDLTAATLKNYDRPKAVELFQSLEFRSLLPRLPEPDEIERAQQSAAGSFKTSLIKTDSTKAERNDIGASKPATSKSQSKSAGASAAAPAQGTQTSLFTEQTSLLGDKPIVSSVAGAQYHLITTEKELTELLKKLEKAKGFVFDTETDFLNGPAIGASFAVEPGEAWYLPLIDKPVGTKTALPRRQEILKRLKPIMEEPTIEKYGHNIKYDYVTLRREAIETNPLSFDTMIASYLLNSSNRQHNLDAVAFAELGIEKIALAELIGVKKLDSLATIEIEKVAQYGAEDADVAYRLYQAFQPRIDDDPSKKVFYHIDMPLVPILGRMEEAGVKLDCNYLQDLSKQLTKRQDQLIKAIYEAAGQEFNINSPSQLSVILFDKLQLNPPTGGPDIKKTKTGISTAASELEKLRGLHPIIELLFEYRELTKLLSTYIDVLPKMVDANQRLHTSYNQTVAATGRLSSTDPNLQNIPIRTEIGRQIRKAFIAEKGKQLVSIDYSQIELRIVAELAKDKALIKIFKEGRDIHQEVADTLGVDRRVGKTLNFAVLYGQGPYSTAGQLGISMNQAREYIDRYFKTYAGVRRFLDDVLKLAKREGYVESLFSRRRYIPEINSSNFAVRAGAERIAMNMPIQGTAADLMKMAMINIVDAEILPSHQAEMLLQVHDELVFEVPTTEVETFSQKAKQIMETVTELSVPLVAEVKIGDNWGEMTPLLPKPSSDN